MTIQGTGSTYIVGSNNNVTITLDPAQIAAAGEQLRARHIEWIKDTQQQAHRSDADLEAFLQRELGKDALGACSIEELAIVCVQLAARWRAPG